jgi:hypothetical protein
MKGTSHLKPALPLKEKLKPGRGSRKWRGGGVFWKITLVLIHF